MAIHNVNEWTESMSSPTVMMEAIPNAFIQTEVTRQDKDGH